MPVVSSSLVPAVLTRALGLLAVLCLVCSEAKADFITLSSDPLIVQTVNKTYSEVRIQETPADNFVDTIWFELSGDTSIKLDFPSPIYFLTNSLNIYFNYQGAVGDTSIAWLVIWDSDRRDTVKIIGINPGPSGPPSASLTYPDFSGIEPGDTLCRIVTFRNHYDYPVLLTDLIKTHPRFTISGISLPIQVGPDTTVKFTLCHVAADSMYTVHDSLVAYYYADNVRYSTSTPLDIVMQQCFEIVQDSISFGTIAVGHDSSAQFTIINPAPSAITLHFTTWSGEHTNKYTFNDSLIQIPAKSSANITLTVAVNEAGQYFDRWIFYNADSSCQQVFNVFVNGAINSCFTTDLDTLELGPIMLGNDTTVDLMFANTSDETITIEQLVALDDTSNSYVWSESFPLTIAQGDTVYLSLTVTGEEIGNFHRGLTFYNSLDSAGCSTHYANILLNVISNSSLPQVDLFDGDGFDFVTDQTSIPVPIWLRNNGTSNVTITSFEILDSTHFTFRKNPTTPVTIAVGNGKRLDLGFTAFVAGVYLDTLAVTLSDNSVIKIPINGTQQTTASVGTPAKRSHELNAWPNPAISRFTIDFENVQQGHVVITDMLGRVIHQAHASLPMTVTPSGFGMTAGNYIIRVSGNDVTGAPIVRSTMISIK
ncbi:MAG TPA: T9SS type A sorting domain-containing protein [Candidatus Kapabacteria bacterium]|nr:T9SS type A sorting domain-containing protein [Candidatus Kapabacteria bacterium]